MAPVRANRSGGEQAVQAVQEQAGPGEIRGLRGLTRRWLLHPPSANLNGRAGDLVQRVLAARGLASAGDIERFCNPRLSDLHDPSLLHGADGAATHLVEAVRSRRRIVIYGDYDVDGITATAILFHIIKTAQPEADVHTYVPHRLEEGYGLNADALRQIAADGPAVVISVDCGISAIEPARVARECGLDLIITDHHTLPTGTKASVHEGGGVLPEARVIVHPRLVNERGEPYPFPELCGAGVAFKLAWRFATIWCNSQRVSESLQKTLMNLLPLAALGTIADVVPLVGENRIIARYGLQLIRQSPLIGVQALLESSSLAGEHIDSEKVGFVLAPRLNACGRMGHAAEAVRLFTTGDGAEARDIARRLGAANLERQLAERRIAEEAARRAEDCGMTRDDCRIIILADQSWHPGVVGIVCSRLVDRFGRPAVLLQRQGDVCKGSARSIDGYSIHEGLLAASGYLDAFGGHDMAAGLTLRAANLEGFVQALTEHANGGISVDQLVPSARIDCDASVDELDVESVKRLSALSPFGRGNPQPQVRLQGLTVAEAPKQMGAQGKHLSLSVRWAAPDSASRSGRRWLRGVWWNQGSRASDLAAGMCIDAVVQPKINEWNGRVNVELDIRDIGVRER